MPTKHGIATQREACQVILVTQRGLICQMADDLLLTNNTIESTLRKWRKNYKETSNIPFSLVSLHNKDLDQQWVMAWTWNKWRNADGTKDSMLYCDNWRLKDGKIVYLNSAENRPSKSLSKTLNSKIPAK